METNVIVALGIAVGFGIFFLVAAASILFRLRHIKKNGIRTQAEIVEIIPVLPEYRGLGHDIPIYGDLRKLKRPPSYKALICFQDFTGKTIETEYYSKGKYLSHLRIGAKVPIVYLPAKPHNCYAPQDHSNEGIIIRFCIGASISLIWLLFKILQLLK